MIPTEKSVFSSSDPYVWNFYNKLKNSLEKIGTFTVEPKKTSLHVINRAAFLGVHPKKTLLELNIVAVTSITSPRIIKSEHVSSNRYHNRLRITTENEIDQELINWITKAYQLMA